ncbi:MAG: flagellar biosynthetic protein FliO [Vulcanimicrobiaceae bacterium]
MNASFWLQYGFALAVVGLVLLGLHAAVKFVAARAGVVTNAQRTVEVIESVAFTPCAQLHVVRAGSRYVLVGTTRDSIAYLGEIPNGEDSAAQK